MMPENEAGRLAPELLLAKASVLQLIFNIFQ